MTFYAQLFPKDFFDLVFQNTIQNHQFDIEVRVRNSGRVEQHFYRSKKQFEKAWEEIEWGSRHRGHDVDFTVVPRQKSHTQNKEHELPKSPVLNCLWADIDVGSGKPFSTRKEALKRIRKVGPEPTIIVKSGRGLHVYFCLEKEKKVEPQRAELILKSLAAKLEADPAAARLTRLMRVPNTVNQKYGRLVRYEVFPRNRYRLKALERIWLTGETAADVWNKHRNHDLIGSAKHYATFFSAHIKDLVILGRGVEALGLCPFHRDRRPSFSVNLSTGLWTCHSARCGESGNIHRFCKKLKIRPPKEKIIRFPRERVIAQEDEWKTDRAFDECYRFLGSQIHFTHAWQSVLVTLWVMGTYLYRQFPCYGHLWLNSPTTHSGKSKLLTVLWSLCHKATEPQLEPTPAVLFRFPSAVGGTMLLDEVDNLDPQKRSDVISILNSYNSQAVVMRAVPGKSKDFRIKKFSIYCPKVIAGINNLPTTLQDRCIKILLHRKKQSEKVERFMPGMFELQEPLRKQLEAWSVRDALCVIRSYGKRDTLGVPLDIDDRAKDILEPLFAIASVLPPWVKSRLVEATKSIAAERNAEEEESNPVVVAVEILKSHFPANRDVWNLRTDEAVKFFQEEISNVDTKAQTQAILRRLGFRSARARIGTRVLRAYKISRKRLDKLSERYISGKAA